MHKIYVYYINLSERGEFYADVRLEDDETVFEIKGFSIFEDGFMEHEDDTTGLQEYLVSLGIMTKDDILVGFTQFDKACEERAEQDLSLNEDAEGNMALG